MAHLDNLLARHLGETDVVQHREINVAKALAPVSRLKHTVHIRNQQRNGRKSLTTIQGLPHVIDVPEGYEIDLKKVLKYMMRLLCTNGTILKDEDGHSVLQLQGDCRRQAYDFLIKHNVCPKQEITVH